MAKSSKKIPWIALLEDPIYLRTIHLVVGDAGLSRKLIAKKTGADEDDLTSVVASHYGSVVTFKHGKYVIWLRNFKFDAVSIDTLVHEMTHLTFSVMQYVGMTLSDESEEAFAYYSGYITNQIIKLIQKHK